MLEGVTVTKEPEEPVRSLRPGQRGEVWAESTVASPHSEPFPGQAGSLPPGAIPAAGVRATGVLSPRQPPAPPHQRALAWRSLESLY